MPTSEPELLSLPDGTTILVRPVRPSDKEEFRRGFARLSAASRFFRFLGERKELSDEDLRYLTEVDGHDHYAVVAAHRRPDGSEEGVGVARFVRLPERPEVAEVAITVIDDWQRRGLGTLLYERLVEAARERGVRILRSEVHRTNLGIRGLLGKVAPDTEVRRSGAVVTLELEI